MVSVVFTNWVFIFFLVSFVLNLYLFGELKNYLLDELKNKKAQKKNVSSNRRSGNRFID